MKKTILFSLLLVIPITVFAQEELVPATDSYIRAKVISISPEQKEESAGTLQSTQEAQLLVLDGEEAGETIIIENNILNDRDDMRLREGEKVVVQRIEKANGVVSYYMREKYRLPSLFALTFFFFLLGVLLGGRVGFTSILGLSASIAILVFFVVPKIIAGSNALVISLIGAVLIAFSSLYLAHGFNRRTSIALVSTIITLALSTVLAVAFVHFGKLFGMGTEETVFLQLGVFEQVNLRGLLLGGIIIGALGVLDDITTAQTAALDELSKANHKLGFHELYKAGTSIGREHIASLINTLALAYVGASLPILLLFSINEEMPWWVIVNSEFVAEEIIRTLVGSSTLLLAVPISTWIAARTFANGNHTKAKGHAHVH
ncbi:MAG: YibE/F family protein [bacterium]|nr:YibE/F family protein [bacterium]